MKDASVTPMASPGRRAAAYWFADGLPDIALGTTLLVFGSAGLWWSIHSPEPAARTWLDFFCIAIGVLLLMGSERALLGFLKSRVTYPRTGYVQPPDDVPDRLIGQPGPPIALSLRPGPPPDENATHFQTRTVTVVFLWCFLFLGQNPWRSWYTLLGMPALAVALYAWNRKSERPYRWWSALILALSGPALLWLDVSLFLQPLLMPLLAGLWMTAQGAYALVRYLRANPYPRVREGVRA